MERNLEDSKRRDNLVREQLLREGLSLKVVAAEEGKQRGRRPTRQAVSAYVNKRPLLEKEWEDAKLVKKIQEQENQHQALEARLEARKPLLRGYTTLCSVLLQYRDQQLEKSSLPVQKAYAYTLPRQQYHIPSFDKLVDLFTLYYDAKQREKKFSLAELSSATEISPITISRILKIVGEEPMYGAHDRHITKPWQHKAIERMYHQLYNAATVAYFLGVDDRSVQERWKAKGKHEHKSTALRIFFLKGTSDVLTYARASAIYETYDAGFTSTKEIAKVTERSNLMVRYALDHRTEIEPQLIDIIRKTYDILTYNKPYVTERLRTIARNREQWTQQRLF